MTQRKRRRSVYSSHIQPGFTISSLTNLAAIPALTAIVTLVGFYYSTSGTLVRYGDEIKIIQSKIAEKSSEDTQAREKIRDAFLQNQSKTNEGIAKLDTRLAVAEEQQKTANAALLKISETLQKISSFNGRKQ